MNSARLVLHKVNPIGEFANISVVIAAASIVVATLYNALTLRNENETRQAQLYIEIFDKLRIGAFIESWIAVIYHQDYKDAEEWVTSR